ncbi:MAG: hypothetical protein O7F71_07195 [Gammaproteobacteria bacterium]|nr:hypothetical protein [Gammaproteobacteria bacterium]
MTKLVSIFLGSFLLMTCVVRAAESPAVVEGFACNFLEGQGMAELQTATDNFNAAIGNLESEDVANLRAFLWVPYRTNAPYDVIWTSNHANLNAMGRFTSAVEADAAATAAVVAFDDVVDCDSAISLSEQIYTGEGPPVTDPPALLESYRCNLLDGKTIADARAAATAWSAHVGNIASYGSAIAFMRTPLISGFDSDLSYLIVHNSVEEYAARNTDYINSDGVDAIGAGFNAVHTCRGGLFMSNRVVPPPE